MSEILTEITDEERIDELLENTRRCNFITEFAPGKQIVNREVSGKYLVIEVAEYVCGKPQDNYWITIPEDWWEGLV